LSLIAERLETSEIALPANLASSSLGKSNIGSFPARMLLDMSSSYREGSSHFPILAISLIRLKLSSRIFREGSLKTGMDPVMQFFDSNSL